MSIIWALCAATATAPQGTLVDQVVAVVDKEVITASEVLVEARVALALREGPKVASTPLDEELLLAFREHVVNETLIAAQARRLAAVEISREEVRLAIRHFAGRFRSDVAYRAFLRRFGISAAQVENILRRRLRSEKYLAERRRLTRTDRGENGEGQHSLQRYLNELRSAAEIRLLGPDGTLELQSKRPTGL